MILAGAVAGILGAVYGLPVWAAASAAFFLAGAGFLTWNKLRTIGRATIPVGFGLALAYAWTLWMLPAKINAPIAPAVYRGVVDYADGGSLSPTLTVSVGRSPKFRISLHVEDAPFSFLPGDSIEFRARLTPAQRYVDIPGITHRRKQLLANRISATGYCHGNEIKYLGQSTALKYYFPRQAARMSSAIADIGLGARSANLLAGSLLGSEYVSGNLREEFSSVGISHLLCVSGFHISLIAGMVCMLLFPFRLWRRSRVPRYLIVLAVIWAYVLLAGATPSALRAAGMLSVFLLTAIAGRIHSPYNSLALGCLVVLAVNPLWLFSMGFQLSVCAVAGLLAFANWLNPFKNNRLSSRLLELFLVPMAATVFSLPVLIYYFHTVPISTVLCSAMGCLLLPLFMAVGIMAWAGHSMGLDPHLLVDFADTMAVILENISRHFAAVEQAHRWTGNLQAWQAIILLAGVSCAAIALRTSRSRGKIPAYAVAFLLLVTAWLPIYSPPHPAIATPRGILVPTEDGGEYLTWRTAARGADCHIPYLQPPGGEPVRLRTHCRGTCGHSLTINFVGRGSAEIAPAQVMVVLGPVKHSRLDSILQTGNYRMILVEPYLDQDAAVSAEAVARRHGIPFFHLADGNVILE